MKKITFLLVLFLTLHVFNIYGQEIDSKQANIWSVSFSYAPTSAFYYYPLSKKVAFNNYPLGFRGTLFPVGFNFAVGRNLNQRFSISTGINFKYRSEKKSSIWYEGVATDNMYLFEIPLEVNYKFFKSKKFLNPFIKTGIRNSYFNCSNTVEPPLSQIDDHKESFYLSYEVGAGTYLNIYKSLSIVIASNLTSTLSGLGFFELQGGLKYSF